MWFRPVPTDHVFCCLYKHLHFLNFQTDRTRHSLCQSTPRPQSTPQSTRALVIPNYLFCSRNFQSKCYDENKHQQRLTQTWSQNHWKEPQNSHENTLPPACLSHSLQSQTIQIQGTYLIELNSTLISLRWLYSFFFLFEISIKYEISLHINSKKKN